MDQGPFATVFNFPGHLAPDHADHGFGPLATVVESLLAPGTYIRMHEHQNEDIISWVPRGVMRHDDRTVGPLITDPDHLMVMNAGRSFWHEERTLRTDPPLRMLQIFVRPPELDLEPGIQHGAIEPAEAGAWRFLFGPKDSGAPFWVSNAVRFYDLHLEAGATASVPSKPDHATYLYVFEGRVRLGDAELGEAETALALDEPDLTLEALEPSVVVAFVIDPEAPVTRAGTIGR